VAALDGVHRSVLLGKKQILSVEGITVSLEWVSLSVFSLLKQLGCFFGRVFLYHYRRFSKHLGINSLLLFG
jgi:hypothetical protein